MSTNAITLTADYKSAVVNTMLLAAQRSRSISLENGFTEKQGTFINPWLFGDKSILPLLARLASSLQEIEDGTVLNLMNIAHLLEPSIVVCSVKVGTIELPEPSAVLAAMSAKAQAQAA